MSWRSWSMVLVAALATTACSSSTDDSAATSSAATSTSTSTSASASATTTPPEPAPTPGTVAASPSPVATMPSSAPVTPAATTPPTTAPAPPTTGVVPQGFGTVAGRVTAADGSTCDVCLWLADTIPLRVQGLMGVTDLSGADGMVFRWDEATAGAFWMRDTPQPLSIAFYAPDGAFVSATDMAPCLQPTPDAECPRYGATGPYQFAVEVAAGGLDALLMLPGSRLEVFAEECPLA